MFWLVCLLWIESNLELRPLAALQAKTGWIQMNWSGFQALFECRMCSVCEGLLPQMFRAAGLVCRSDQSLKNCCAMLGAACGTGEMSRATRKCGSHWHWSEQNFVTKRFWSVVAQLSLILRQNCPVHVAQCLGLFFSSVLWQFPLFLAGCSGQGGNCPVQGWAEEDGAVPGQLPLEQHCSPTNSCCSLAVERTWRTRSWRLPRKSTRTSKTGAWTWTRPSRAYSTNRQPRRGGG